MEKNDLAQLIRDEQAKLVQDQDNDAVISSYVKALKEMGLNVTNENVNECRETAFTLRDFLECLRRRSINNDERERQMKKNPKS